MAPGSFLRLLPKPSRSNKRQALAPMMVEKWMSEQEHWPGGWVDRWRDRRTKGTSGHHVLLEMPVMHRFLLRIGAVVRLSALVMRSMR